MRLGDLLAFSAQNVSRTRLRTSLSALGIAIGTASIVVLLSAGTGFQAIAVGQAADIGALTQVIVFPVDAGANQPKPLTADVVSQIRAIPHVKDVETQVALPPVRVSVAGTSAVVPALGGQPLSYDGPFLATGDLSASDAVVMPRSLLDKAGTKPAQAIGQPVGLTVGASVCCPDPRMGGVLASGPDRTYTGHIEAVVDDVPAFRGSPSKPTLLGVAQPLAAAVMGDASGLGQAGYLNRQGFAQVTVNADDARFTPSVERALGQLGFRTISHADSIARAQFVFGMIDVILLALGLIALSVAAVGIANTMIMTVVERTREIGIMKALGAEPAAVRSLLLLEAAFTGIIGGAAGLLVALVVAAAGNVGFQHWLDTTQVTSQGRFLTHATLFQLTWALVLGALVLAIAVSLAGGWFPSRRAVALEPVEALRYE